MKEAKSENEQFFDMFGKYLKGLSNIWKIAIHVFKSNFNLPEKGLVSGKSKCGTLKIFVYNLLRFEKDIHFSHPILCAVGINNWWDTENIFVSGKKCRIYSAVYFYVPPGSAANSLLF